jgi:hypothetical protein
MSVGETPVIVVERAAQTASDRLSFWSEIVGTLGATSAAEIGVWKGEFAAHLLRCCPTIQTYYLIDPWRQLRDWNKPFNVSDERFEVIMDEA